MNLGVSGSRDWKGSGTSAVIRAVASFIEKYHIIDIHVGDCPSGVDAIVRDNFPFKLHVADWAKWGNSAGPKRNFELVKMSDFLLAFPVPGGRGTQNAIGIALKKGIPVFLCDKKGIVTRHGSQHEDSVDG
jgi:hypothetical protein